jgi:chitinase
MNTSRAWPLALLGVLAACEISARTHSEDAAVAADGALEPADAASAQDVGADVGIGKADATPGRADASAGGADAAVADSGGAATGTWSMGYYASWQDTQLPVAEIEWSGLTHLAIAFYEPQADGSLKIMGGASRLVGDLVTAARAHGVKVIASLGGADSGPSFKTATAAGTMAAFVGHIVDLVDQEQLDGVDVDWEPVEKADEPAVIDLAKKIRAARPSVLMTIPISYQNINAPGDLSGYPAIAAVYDQLNIMSYGMAGVWQGWKSWHCSPLYQQDSATPLSIDSSVQLYLKAGVPKQRLGIGIGFYGLCYTPPVTGPDQPLGATTIAASDGSMSYVNIMGSYYDAGARKWDDLAKVPYLSFAAAKGPDGCSFISYDDEQSILEKGAYLKSKGLGGVIQWEINEGYLSSAPAGQRNPLLTAIHDHVLH